MRHYLYGAGGHGKVVVDAMNVAGLVCHGFVDDKVSGVCMGIPVFNTSTIQPGISVQIHLAIGSCEIRQVLAQKNHDFKYFSVIHPCAILSEKASIGEGVFLAAGSIVAPNSSVGSHSIVNHHAIVDHDCVVGDFSHVGPHVCLGGGVSVGRGVLVGSGAVILPGITIGDFAVIGAGAIITKDVMSGQKLAGNPAKILG